MEFQSNPAQPEQSYHPKHHIKVYVWIALVVAAFLGAINGYLYFLRLSYLNQEALTAQQNEQMIQELRAKRSPSTSSGQFEVPADWKTYRNDEYGIEFKYPSDWTLTIDDQYGFPQSGVNSGRDFVVSFEKNSNYIMTVRLESTDYVNIDDYFKQEYTDRGDNSSKTEINVDGVRAFSIEGPGQPSPVERWVVFKKYDFLVRIAFTNENDINQILSTFRFIDTEGTGTLSGKVSIGPNCPVERVGVECTPSPEAYAAREFIVLDSNQKEVTRFHADASGSYSVLLSPGTYTVKSAKTGMGYMSSDLPVTITIKAGQTATLDIDIDTGIR